MPGPGRREFFREALARLARPVGDLVDRHFPSLSGESSPAPPDRPRLRPPGAIEESEFLDTCQCCGKCVEVCPANCIFPLDARFGYAPGTPVIDPDYAACVVCDGLQCTHVCPSGALLSLTDPAAIDMGLAEVYAPVCLRSHNEPCTICVERCPIGERALRFDGSGPPTVLADGCVGCGVCQFYCPTTPKAIVVQSKR